MKISRFVLTTIKIMTTPSKRPPLGAFCTHPLDANAVTSAHSNQASGKEKKSIESLNITGQECNEGAPSEATNIPATDPQTAKSNITPTDKACTSEGKLSEASRSSVVPDNSEIINKDTILPTCENNALTKTEIPVIGNTSEMSEQRGVEAGANILKILMSGSTQSSSFRKKTILPKDLLTQVTENVRKMSNPGTTQVGTNTKAVSFRVKPISSPAQASKSDKSMLEEDSSILYVSDSIFFQSENEGSFVSTSQDSLCDSSSRPGNLNPCNIEEIDTGVSSMDSNNTDSEFQAILPANNNMVPNNEKYNSNVKGDHTISGDNSEEMKIKACGEGAKNMECDELQKTSNEITPIETCSDVSEDIDEEMGALLNTKTCIHSNNEEKKKGEELHKTVSDVETAIGVCGDEDMENEMGALMKINMSCDKEKVERHGDKVLDLSLLFSGELERRRKKLARQERRKLKLQQKRLKLKKTHDKQGIKKVHDKQGTNEEKESGTDDKPQPKSVPNYFLAVQITNDQIRQLLEEIQQHMVMEESKLTPALTRPTSLHITLMVLSLNTSEDISRSIIALDKVRETLCSLYSDRSLLLDVAGLGHFRNEVVFAKLKSKEQIEELQTIVGHLEESFQGEGILFPDTRGFKPHITIAKMSKVRGAKKKDLKKIPDKIYKDYIQQVFGTQIVSTVQLCSMFKPKDSQGYYYVEHAVNFGKVTETADGATANNTECTDPDGMGTNGTFCTASSRDRTSVTPSTTDSGSRLEKDGINDNATSNISPFDFPLETVSDQSEKCIPSVNSTSSSQ